VATGRLSEDRRRETVREVLPEVERLTVPQIKERMRRAEIVNDPHGADERRRATTRAERFVRVEPVDGAMAYLTAYLPADDAAQVMAAVEAVAVPMHRTPGEERRLDECRADAFVGLTTRTLTGPGGAADPTSSDAPSDAPTTRRGSGAGVLVTIAMSTLLGADDLPAFVAGHGPVPAAMGRALAADPDASWRRMLTDPLTGVLTDLSSRCYRPSPALRAAVIARDMTCTFPGCWVPAWRGDLDHVEPFDPDDPGAQTHGTNLHALCRAHHRAKTVGGWSVSRDAGTGITRWTAPTGHLRPAPSGRRPQPSARAPGGPAERRPTTVLIDGVPGGGTSRPQSLRPRPDLRMRTVRGCARVAAPRPARRGGGEACRTVPSSLLPVPHVARTGARPCAAWRVPGSSRRACCTSSSAGSRSSSPSARAARPTSRARSARSPRHPGERSCCGLWPSRSRHSHCGSWRRPWSESPARTSTVRPARA
jgi:hypothetical protein